MSDFYDDALATASEMLTEFGMPITLRKRTPGDYDPELGEAPVTLVEVTTKGVELPMQDQMVDGTMVLRGDRRVLLDPTALVAAGVEPDAGDEIVAGVTGQTSDIINVKKLAPAGKVVLYTLQTRG